jgi:hypothetical protein
MVSGKLPHLELVCLIRHEIKQICRPCSADSSAMKELKRPVSNNFEKRIPESATTNLAALLDPATRDTVDLSYEQKVELLALVKLLKCNFEACNRFFSEPFLLVSYK